MLKDRVRRWLRRVVPAQPKLTLRDSLKCLESDERSARDRDHFFEWSTFVEKIAQAELAARVEFLMAIDYSIHFHTFTLQSMLALLDHMRHDMRVPFHVKACADVLAGSNEFIVVLGRS
jgi:hypothetical protein